MPGYYDESPLREFESEFNQEPWMPDEMELYFDRLLEEYYDTTEEYDESVCTAEHDGVAVPANWEERKLITHHARQTARELIARARLERELSREAAADSWRQAMERCIRRRSS